ncbi:enterochelin esterase [Streptomyces sp. NPDC051740]|uniref:enterochelin esterase n=1 Tax=Streptomyces sp. NPDC051740 TaxID=3365673 RepID=UPI0037967450
MTTLPTARRRGAAVPDDVRPVRVTGPRVARLLDEVEGADAPRRTALADAFWNEVEERGTPPVEALDGRPGHRAVTFLWRGHRATRRVLLSAHHLTDRGRPAGSLLERVPGTDVWHLGLRLRADHRGSYRLVADLSPKEPVPGPDGLQQRLRSLTAHAAADPRGRLSVPTRWRPADSSVFALPGAPPQPWAGRRGHVPAGHVERHRVAGAAPIGDRDVWVYLPPGSGRTDVPLPVAVVCDGDMWFGRMGFGDTLDALIADGALPPLVVVAPDAVDRCTRWRDLGGREPFVAFPADELLPWAAGRRPLTTDPRRTVVVGQSLGGVTALYAALLRPERFGNVLAQPASLWWRPGVPAPAGAEPAVYGTPWLAGRYACAPARPVTVHLDVDLHEGAMVDHHRALYEVLRPAGHRVTYDTYNGGHDYACWHGAPAAGLIRLLGGSTTPTDTHTALATSATPAAPTAPAVPAGSRAAGAARVGATAPRKRRAAQTPPGPHQRRGTP